jgi:hypothetical protein
MGYEKTQRVERTLSELFSAFTLINFLSSAFFAFCYSFEIGIDLTKTFCLQSYIELYQSSFRFYKTLNADAQ